MAISFNKLISLLEVREIGLYTLKKQAKLGGATLDNIKNGTGGVSTIQINKICEVLNCQPGDIMEYVPDTEKSGR